MEQKNKVYEHPEMEVVKLEAKPLLAGSDATASGEEMDGSLFTD